MKFVGDLSKSSICYGGLRSEGKVRHNREIRLIPKEGIT